MLAVSNDHVFDMQKPCRVSGLATAAKSNALLYYLKYLMYIPCMYLNAVFPLSTNLPARTRQPMFSSLPNVGRPEC